MSNAEVEALLIELQHAEQQQHAATQREQAEQRAARAVEKAARQKLPPQPRLDPVQRALLLDEPRTLYHAPLSMPARFALCHRVHPDGRVHQDFYPVDRLEWLARQIERMPDRERRHFWISQATLRGSASNRRISSIILLNAAWVDIDLLHPPASFDRAMMPAEASPEQQAALLAAMIADAGLPPPSYIIATGGGLCPKWIFTASIPSEARPRWQSLQRFLVQRISGIRYEVAGRKIAWPVDPKASDAARVLRLVGTVNPRWGTRCRIVWDSGQTHDFDALADAVLPYSRAQVEAFRKDAARWKTWDENRAKAAAAGLQRPKALADAALEDEAARGLWAGRFEFGRALLDIRGGPHEGSRNAWWWPMANALAYSCGSEDQLLHELAALHQQYWSAAGWTRGEAMQAAGSIMRRLKEGGVGRLYKMKSRTFLEALEVTPSERQALAAQGLGAGGAGHNAKRDQWKQGVMGFGRMEGLDFDAFLAETRRRQAEAGRRSAQVRNTGPDPEKVAQAREMASAGMTQRAIGAALGVSQMTVSKWLRSV